MLNKKLLKAVRHSIATDPEHFNQTVWHKPNNGFPPFGQFYVVNAPLCKTAHCVAGWTQVHYNRMRHKKWNSLPRRYLYSVNESLPFDYVVVRHDNMPYKFAIAKFAQEALGIESNSVASQLFSAYNSRDDVLRMLDWLINLTESEQAEQLYTELTEK